MYPPPKLLGAGSFTSHLLESKSPIHIPDFATHPELNSVAETVREYVTKIGVPTARIVPMLRKGELVGSLSLGRWRIEPLTKNEIELVADLAAQAAIALEVARHEREPRDLQMELARVNRIATMEKHGSSIGHEVIQPIATVQ
jgi:GAF domain-containing protein